MAKIISFIAEKGGTTRSSVIFNSAWELSKLGKKILIIDLDGQDANITYYSGALYSDSDDVKTILSVFRGKDIKDAIINIKDNIDIVPATSEVKDLGQTAKLSVFKKALSSVSDNYDYIFIDVNPTPGWTHFLSLSVAYGAVIVSLPDEACLKSNQAILQTIEEIQDSTNPNLKILGVLFGKDTNRTLMAKNVHRVTEMMAAEYDTSVFKSSIRNAVVMGEFVSFHRGITDYNPTSAAADDIRDFVKELMERIEN